MKASERLNEIEDAMESLTESLAKYRKAKEGK